MHYLIDGHNLIPYVVPGGMQNMEKEEKLLELLQAFQLGAKGSMRVFFDKAPAGRAGVVRSGKITVQRVQSSLEADEAILQFLAKQGTRAGEFTVVSSDRKVQNGAKRLRAKVMQSQDFYNNRHSRDARPGSSAGGKPSLSLEDDQAIQEHFLKKQQEEN